MDVSEFDNLASSLLERYDNMVQMNSKFTGGYEQEIIYAMQYHDKCHVKEREIIDENKSLKKKIILLEGQNNTLQLKVNQLMKRIENDLSEKYTAMKERDKMKNCLNDIKYLSQPKDEETKKNSVRIIEKNKCYERKSLSVNKLNNQQLCNIYSIKNNQQSSEDKRQSFNEDHQLNICNRPIDNESLISDISAKISKTNSHFTYDPIDDDLPHHNNYFSRKDGENDDNDVISQPNSFIPKETIKKATGVRRRESNLNCSIISQRLNCSSKRRRPTKEFLDAQAVAEEESDSTKDEMIDVQPSAPLSSPDSMDNKENVPKSIEKIYPKVSYKCNLPMQTVEQQVEVLFHSTMTRDHNFQSKAMITPETCLVCNRRLRFGKYAAKCRKCETYCHLECQDRLPLPCMVRLRLRRAPHGAGSNFNPGKGNTPVHGQKTKQYDQLKSTIGLIEDFVDSSICPTGNSLSRFTKNYLCIPPLVLHCVREIERRGLTEVGLYRLNGADSEVRSIRTALIYNRGTPDLTRIRDVMTICCALKDFFRSLREPLITARYWEDFISLTSIQNDKRKEIKFNGLLLDLPDVNRDTLAFMIIHLKKVSESLVCRMPIANIGKCLGPSLIGYSQTRTSAEHMLSVSFQQAALVSYFLTFSYDFWNHILLNRTKISTD
ncbi:hypothetical protein SNEBB_000288 [Seison nebaliae]|nr:hypothetical protein SNEBB_000288 [Seison nebaliae]